MGKPRKQWTVKDYEVRVAAGDKLIGELRAQIEALRRSVQSRDDTIRGFEQLRDRDRAAISIIKLACEHMTSFGKPKPLFGE